MSLGTCFIFVGGANLFQNIGARFQNKIVIINEATFTRRGVFIWRNNHLWDSENPYAVKKIQHECKLWYRSFLGYRYKHVNAKQLLKILMPSKTEWLTTMAVMSASTTSNVMNGFVNRVGMLVGVDDVGH
ncbi:hypothetical protein NQ318_019450 [Aromia moschata]|uniref:Uncharacterized protein n=1 Tax=Aromia moschata TaxID=1265417 RepID=A0AAV8XBK5_9CUCU|nr:hypothetical protein NQ318_019450 [Aromia moschata]